jgi:hypothetical protein
MRILRRIVIAAPILIVVLVACVGWVAPIALSFYAARKAPAIARIVPTELKEQSVSQAPGTRLTYLGYQFEVPWTDLDETQTKLYPKEKSEQNRVDLRFRSGLRLVVTAAPQGEFGKTVCEETHISPQDFEASFGKSDYSFLRTVYEFSPERMNHWSVSTAVHAREGVLLTLKSLIPSKSAVSGIFKVGNQNYQGFQQGDPRVREDAINLELFSDDGGIEFILLQKGYRSGPVTQPELNRIIQSLHKAPQSNLPLRGEKLGG